MIAFSNASILIHAGLIVKPVYSFRREEAIMRLLRFTRNDMEARIMCATFWVSSATELSERGQRDCTL